MRSKQGRKRAGRTLALALSITATVAALATLVIRGAGAYEAWSVNRTSGFCADCHGDFRASGYVSNHDGVAWTGGTSLHNGHRSNMLNSDCNTCHTASRFPTFLSVSSGGSGFAPIGCLGCHGRAEPSAGGAVTGLGLRQHHMSTLAATCDGAGCHSDTDPVTSPPAKESVLPPYYFAPDAAHPNKPTDPCNANGSESLVAPPLGLDNDGNNIYDAAGCVSTGVTSTAGPLLRLEGACPNPSPQGRLRVAFTLSVADQAVLEAIDVNGRRIAAREVGSMGVGRHLVDLAAGRTLAPGIYVLKLTQGGRTLQTTAAVIR